jgi:hypothetical protein
MLAGRDELTFPSRLLSPGLDSDVMEIGDGFSGKAKKATSRSEKEAVGRQRSMSLTPPPELDPMLLRRVDSQVRFVLPFLTPLTRRR